MQQVADPFAAQGQIRPASPVGNNNSQTLLPKRTVKNKLRNIGRSIKRSVSPPAPGNPNLVVKSRKFCNLSPTERKGIVNAIRPSLESAMGPSAVSGLATIISDITQNPTTAGDKAAEIQTLFSSVQGPGTNTVNPSRPAALPRASVPVAQSNQNENLINFPSSQEPDIKASLPEILNGLKEITQSIETANTKGEIINILYIYLKYYDKKIPQLRNLNNNTNTSQETKNILSQIFDYNEHFTSILNSQVTNFGIPLAEIIEKYESLPSNNFNAYIQNISKNTNRGGRRRKTRRSVHRSIKRKASRKANRKANRKSRRN